MKQFLVLALAALMLLLCIAPAYAWVGSGSVYKTGEKEFWATVYHYGGQDNYLIRFTVNLTNDFVYGNYIQESYNHQIYGSCRYQTEMDQWVAGNICYYENGSFIAAPTRERDVYVWTSPDYFPWGWGNYSTRVRNYYPGGPDYVTGTGTWHGSSWYGSLLPNIADKTLRYDFR